MLVDQARDIIVAKISTADRPVIALSKPRPRGLSAAEPPRAEPPAATPKSIPAPKSTVIMMDGGHEVIARSSTPGPAPRKRDRREPRQNYTRNAAKVGQGRGF